MIRDIINEQKLVMGIRVWENLYGAIRILSIVFLQTHLAKTGSRNLRLPVFKLILFQLKNKTLQGNGIT